MATRTSAVSATDALVHNTLFILIADKLDDMHSANGAVEDSVQLQQKTHISRIPVHIISVRFAIDFKLEDELEKHLVKVHHFFLGCNLQHNSGEQL
jgi:hypothetical protein